MTSRRLLAIRPAGDFEVFEGADAFDDADDGGDGIGDLAEHGGDLENGQGIDHGHDTGDEVAFGEAAFGVVVADDVEDDLPAFLGDEVQQRLVRISAGAVVLVDPGLSLLGAQELDVLRGQLGDVRVITERLFDLFLGRFLRTCRRTDRQLRVRPGHQPSTVPVP
ncbi:hypothetical protein [Amycolatopsis sp. MJM2582]|uniref:hypothetical protein n=1 Tax=Amycolatopsis sp. MJM2582 TaxID=1427749 RepID=UPI00190F9278|nr:hypothetical protein [Amycolatopsis sp. MJM2582]